MSTIPELLDKYEAAKACGGVSVRTLEGWRVRGRGPRYVKLGGGLRGRVVYSVEAISEYLQANTFQSTAETTPRQPTPKAKRPCPAPKATRWSRG